MEESVLVPHMLEESVLLGIHRDLGWEIHSEFRGILRSIWFRTFWTPEFSLEFYFSDRKMCSSQFWSHFFRFRMLSRHLFFQFHESENVPAMFVSSEWHQILIINAPTLFVHTIANPLLTISTWYTQIYENLINVSRYRHHSDDKDLADFQFSSSQESKIEPPLVIDSIWDCPGITLDTIEDDDGKTILGWCCVYCLIPSNHGGSRFFKHRNASKALSHLTKEKDIVTCTDLRNIPANVVHALTALKYSKANRKRDIAVQRNNLHEEVEQQQDHVLGARIDR
jgi:hypothetical protein